ncbi:hypothetical protein DVR12_21110 [Chitinophaga silvatica]|uniref:Capsule assembly Wzi family protein n=1 Tax=Chitinophaga silvatica TaxID=2282649 RepID=A0A3E1Y6N6_9BACT|nr:hypothetical protein [Chitinophaga silvatica]RFS20217.1 hypothetical protein DVR12_21110 [Chitinophaga silvatica]
MKNLYWVAFLLFPLSLAAQSDNIDLGNKQYNLLDRLDIRTQNDTLLGFTSFKPYSRKKMTERVQWIDSMDQKGLLPFRLTPTDKYNIRQMLSDNWEWSSNDVYTRKPLLGVFYRRPGAFYAVNVPDFKLTINPVLNLQYGAANDGTGSIYQNTRGIVLRGVIANKVGFYTYLTDNQERDPAYVRDFVTKHDAVPGAGFYKDFSTNAYDYFDARGGIFFNAAKYFDIQFAYDKLFIGNGYRSLFLSDFSSNYLYLRISTRIWKFDYENIISQTIAPFPPFHLQRELRPQNYMMMHHLSLQVTRWLNLGFYENIMEDGSHGLQLSYLNPVIFYRSIEQQLGSVGKANIGFEVKANIAKSVQVYGQLLINEFVTKEVLHYRKGNFANKQAFQLGLKYIDVFNIKNLDLQFEANYIRPFTYTNYDSTTNFTHYNQPLAHPMGANLKEFIGILRYQPVPRLYITGKLMHNLQGLDSAGFNMGGDVFRSYNTRPRDYGFFIGSGIPTKTTYAALNLSYELIPNTFLDLNTTYRTNVFFYTLGFRMNIRQREFNF